MLLLSGDTAVIDKFLIFVDEAVVEFSYGFDLFIFICLHILLIVLSKHSLVLPNLIVGAAVLELVLDCWRSVRGLYGAIEHIYKV